MYSVARPYARAAFEYALEHKQVASWLLFLKTVAVIVKDKRVANLLDNPNIDYSDKQKFILGICGKTDQAQKNFIATLGLFQRLNVSPEVAKLFEEHDKEQNKSIEVEVTSAYPLNEQQIKRLQQALAIRLQREITLKLQIDKKLMGGALIKAGDFVIDGTSLGQLQRLAEELIE